MNQTWAMDNGPEKFAQLDYLLRSPNESRLASGAPGPQYWQQRADYRIKIKLDDQKQRIQGYETITYHNLSPHNLKYIWLQLDQNRFKPNSDDMLTKTAPNFDKFPYKSLSVLLARHDFLGGYDITEVSNKAGQLEYTLNKTLMRIELPKPLQPFETFSFNIGWQHNINDATLWGRGGYEYFKKEDNYIYEIAQFYPRVVAYTDYDGWHNKQFLGNGEFTLELGDYHVEITVPSDHIVAATGELQNVRQVLTKKQLKRFVQAKKAKKPIFIVTPDEALQNQTKKSKQQKTWIFNATNVRDFAWASSRKFIWDGMGVKSGKDTVLAMSFYPNEAEPLWSQYSTHAIAHTIDVFSRYTFDYPYPVAISVNGAVGGMEYPMISFNKPRPYADKTYWDVKQPKMHDTWARSKYGLISVIIHEVGHNYFPMIINSDERQWTWMDEGLTTFLQFVAEQEWEPNYPSRRGEPKKITHYMSSSRVTPIMTNSESIYQFGNNAYGKPATALNILRESILGRELFDYAFREYAERWKFKRPTPADFFRTMEDASGVDLDWFWRGWFYSTDHVDIAIESVSEYTLNTQQPDIEQGRARATKAESAKTRSQLNNVDNKMRVDAFPELKDFYTEFDEFAVTPYDYAQYESLIKSLEDKERVLLNIEKHFYAVDFKNIGGLVMPLPLKITYQDQQVESYMIPAEIWRYDASKVTKLFITDQPIISIEFDPHLETADTDVSNNAWPHKVTKHKFELFKYSNQPNHMQRIEK
ncbi:M1 family metallopeptidase [Algibacillus agarilyticus]|uniref:M1 family metallopeptidase n=1 Tax=Algibacillus agarilyticus TaxID=2234133 RepID=UPI0018E57C36|nr:M1 family metallopeptidase [Algibacillus agarilyticus]